MRASSTSRLHRACQENTITQTCGSLARQLHPVINNGIVVAQVEVGVVRHVHHCRLGRHRSYPEHFRKRMCSTCLDWLQIQGCLSKSVRNRDENVPREALVSVRWYQAESESLTVLCFPFVCIWAVHINMSLSLYLRVREVVSLSSRPFHKHLSQPLKFHLLKKNFETFFLLDQPFHWDQLWKRHLLPPWRQQPGPTTSLRSSCSCSHVFVELCFYHPKSWPLPDWKWNLIICSFKGEFALSNPIASSSDDCSQVPEQK